MESIKKHDTLPVCSSCRKNEYNADQFANFLGYSKELISVLSRISGGIYEKSGFWQLVNSTHPDTYDRIERLKTVPIAI